MTKHILKADIKISLLVLIVSNLTILLLALVQQWDFSVLLWGYWFQSIIIGLFQAKKMVDLKTKQANKVAGFFFLHYGIFHLAYLFFLLISVWPLSWAPIFIFATIFFISHLISYFVNKASDEKRQLGLGKLMFLPYMRILPMHILIVFGWLFIGGSSGLVLFLLLKIVADVISHHIEHQADVKITQY